MCHIVLFPLHSSIGCMSLIYYFPSLLGAVFNTKAYLNENQKKKSWQVFCECAQWTYVWMDTQVHTLRWEGVFEALFVMLWISQTGLSSFWIDMKANSTKKILNGRIWVLCCCCCCCCSCSPFINSFLVYFFIENVG